MESNIFTAVKDLQDISGDAGCYSAYHRRTQITAVASGAGTGVEDTLSIMSDIVRKRMHSHIIL